MRWPGRNTWFAVGSANRYSSGVFGRDRLRRLEALAIPAAEDVGRDHELVSAHRRLAGRLRRDRRRSASRPSRRPCRRSTRRGSRSAVRLILTGVVSASRGEGQHVRPARRLALVVDQPVRPRERHCRSRSVESGARGTARASPDRTRTRRTRRVAGAERRSSRLQPGCEVQRRWVDRCSRSRTRPATRGRRSPGVRAGLERGDRRDVRLRRAVLEILIEEGTENIALKVERRVAARSGARRACCRRRSPGRDATARSTRNTLSLFVSFGLSALYTAMSP